MRTVLFTKLLPGRRPEELAKIAADTGFDAIDLLIRPGWLDPREPDRVRDAIGTFGAAGLAVPMITTDITDPTTSPEVDRLLGLCAETGVDLIRVGYWQYDPILGYANCFDTARRNLDVLEMMARRAGVRFAIQLHGGTIHSSGSLTAALLDGHDPVHLGAYPDPGNQAVQDGREDWRLTFDLLQPWLCCVGVKNGGWFPSDLSPTGQRLWRSDWLPIADGMVPWQDVLAYLDDSGFDGLLSFHSHYEVPLAQALDQTRSDLNFVHRQLQQAAS